MDIYARLKELGISVPSVPKPVASYEPAVIYGELVYASGQTGTVDGVLRHEGKLGREIGIEEARESARISVLNCLAAVETVIGDLNRVKRIVRLTGYVASAEGFGRQPEVIEGASALLLQIFGDAGKHARSAIGVAELPYHAPVEVELIVQFA